MAGGGRGGGENFATYCRGGWGGDFFLAYFLGGGRFFLTRYFCELFFVKVKLHVL